MQPSSAAASRPTRAFLSSANCPASRSIPFPNAIWDSFPCMTKARPPAETKNCCRPWTTSPICLKSMPTWMQRWAIARSASPLVVAQPFWEERPEELTGGPLSPEHPHSHAESATPPFQDSPAHAPDRVSSEESGRQHPVPTLPSAVKAPVSIGYVRDAALWFYYEENLEALRRAGARLVELSILSPEPWPCDELNGLYLGGGFPEMVPERIAASPHLEELRALSRAECPIYAECGGFMILCREIRIDGRDYPMASLFPARAEFYSRPQGLGYVEATVERENPFHPGAASCAVMSFIIPAVFLSASLSRP